MGDEIAAASDLNNLKCKHISANYDIYSNVLFKYKFQLYLN